MGLRVEVTVILSEHVTGNGGVHPMKRYQHCRRTSNETTS
jgi:hypothetical protein